MSKRDVNSYFHHIMILKLRNKFRGNGECLICVCFNQTLFVCDVFTKNSIYKDELKKRNCVANFKKIIIIIEVHYKAYVDLYHSLIQKIFLLFIFSNENAYW